MPPESPAGNIICALSFSIIITRNWVGDISDTRKWNNIGLRRCRRPQSFQLAHTLRGKPGQESKNILDLHTLLLGALWKFFWGIQGLVRGENSQHNVRTEHKPILHRCRFDGWFYFTRQGFWCNSWIGGQQCICSIPSYKDSPFHPTHPLITLRCYIHLRWRFYS